MKRNHYLILGGIALIGGYLWYKKNKEERDRKASSLVSETTPLASMDSSNASGATCTCDNGFTGYCQSGDCGSCCGTYNKKKRPTETRTYNFMRTQKQARKEYGSNY